MLNVTIKNRGKILCKIETINLKYDIICGK